MLLYATDALDTSERAELQAHLATGCPQCAGALAEAQATLAHLPLALDPQTPSKSARDRLMQRVAADISNPRGNPRGVSTSTAPKQTPWFLKTAVAATVGAIIAAAAVYLPMHEKTSMIQTDQLQYVKLAGDTTLQPKAHGRVFWDKDKNDWHVYVFDMAPPPPGKTYELWFITPNQTKIRAGLIEVDAKGKGSLTVKVPANIPDIAVAAVTDEPLGGVDQPTGKVQIFGKVENNVSSR